MCANIHNISAHKNITPDIPSQQVATDFFVYKKKMYPVMVIYFRHKKMFLE